MASEPKRIRIRTMTEYIVGLDSMYGIEAESPEEAEEELARRLDEGDVDVSADDCVTYEERPE